MRLGFLTAGCLCWIATACSSPKSSLIPLGNGSTTVGGVTSGGAGTSTASGTTGITATGGAAGTAGESGTNSSGETSGTSGTSGLTGGGTTTGDLTCGLGAVWRGDQCVLLSCADASLLSHCLLGDGGIGVCAAESCQSFDPDTDPSNCGSFGIVCPTSSTCQFGCTSSLPGYYGGCFGDAGTCPVGMVPVGTPCQNASCVWWSCNDAERDQGCLLRYGDDAYIGICCGESCIPVGSDPTNCGACGHACGAGELCVQWGSQAAGLIQTPGQCAPASPCDAAHNDFTCQTDAGLGTCCLGQCISSFSYPYCGVCGQSCADAGGWSGDCWSGAECPTGTACDAMRGWYCSPLSCQGLEDGLACVQDGGSVPLQCCAGSCMDLNFDSNNCGICGLQCPSDTVCQAAQCFPPVNCAEGSNGESCWLSPALGEGTCCEGRCVNTVNDQSNCGGCGFVCSGQDVCTNWTCSHRSGELSTPIEQCGPGSTGNYCTSDAGAYSFCSQGQCMPGFPTSGATGQCDAGIGCALGSVCIYGACIATACPPDSNGASCPFGPSEYLTGVCCSATCVNLLESADNCGGCGIKCASGVCGGYGVCLPARPDSDCPGGCPEDSVCARGLCVDSFCDVPFYSSTDALGTPVFCAARGGAVGLCGADGVCADLANDASNCGGFGFVCPAGQSCAHGVCSGAPPECGIGRIGGYCNLDAGPSFLCCPGVGCTDSSTDVTNCGGCSQACAPGQSCLDGICQ
jgi:hypothetical protein